MTVKFEAPIDEPTVKVLLLYHHPNFKYCSLFVSGMELGTDGWTDRQTNGWRIRLLDAPGGPFRLGHKNLFMQLVLLIHIYVVKA